MSGGNDLMDTPRSATASWSAVLPQPRQKILGVTIPPSCAHCAAVQV